MPRRSPKRDESQRVWLESNGEISIKELSKLTGTKPEQLRKWKSLDKWKDKLKERNKPKRGGQPGNKNAVGGGAPLKNRNAETHGAYITARLEDLPEEQQKYIQNITLDSQTNMLQELQRLTTKEFDLQNRISALMSEKDSKMFVDSVLEYRTPKKEQFKGSPDSLSNFNISGQEVTKSSSFERRLKLEAELNKTNGRIIKLLDSIKAYELECRRLHLEERKYNLAKQKLAGVYDIDPETGEIIDSADIVDENNDELI